MDFGCDGFAFGIFLDKIKAKQYFENNCVGLYAGKEIPIESISEYDIIDGFLYISDEAREKMSLPYIIER